jgi:hypothetical protein
VVGDVAAKLSTGSVERLARGWFDDRVNRTLRLLPAVPLLLVAAACGPDKPSRADSAPSFVAPALVTPAGPVTGDPAALAAAAVAAMSDADLAGEVLMPYAYGDSATAVDAASKAGNQKIAGVDTPAQMVAKFPSRRHDPGELQRGRPDQHDEPHDQHR